MVNPDILSLRYATPEINEIFSEKGRILAERGLWINVMKAQRELGVNIPEEVITYYENAKNDVDLELIKEIELKTRHDVKARIEAFNTAAGGYEQIHRGMTSRDLTDNVDQVQIRKASEIIFGKYVSVLRHFKEKAVEYDSLIMTARTHHQPAQLTTLGRRFSMWGEELLYHLKNFENFIQEYPLRGIKGPVGTQEDMLALLGSKEKVEDFEKIVAESLGFSKVLSSPGQVYPRSLDYALASHLVGCSAACENFAKTMRLMCGYELVTEGFKKGQVGSSAMPHKMNTRSSERVCGFSRLLKTYAGGLSGISGDQWEEGDVSDSAVRRATIQDLFYASDGLCETTLTILNEMGVYPEMIGTEVDKYLPFLATTELITAATKKGLGREKAHETIKKRAVSESLRIRETRNHKNELAELLGKDDEFPLNKQEIKMILDDKECFAGNVKEQIIGFVKKAGELIEKYPEKAAYEPGQIL